MDLRAVLVDDEQLARDELSYLLGRMGGVEVIGQAGNGIEALTTIDRLQPDVVFLDVQMPGLTGFEVARRMLGSCSALPLLILTWARARIAAPPRASEAANGAEHWRVLGERQEAVPPLPRAGSPKPSGR